MYRAICPVCIAILFTLPAGGETSSMTQPASFLPPSVLVLPFVPPADANLTWVGRSVQQDLAAAVAPNLRGRTIAPATAPAAPDEATALEAGLKFIASAVVFGQAQVMGKEIRITGQVLDVASGKSLGNVKETGSVDDLFRLEDGMASQVIMALPTSVLNLRGIAASREASRPRVIFIPDDAPANTLNNGPIDGPIYTPLAPPYTLPPPPGGNPPYSPYAGSFPSRFVYPYSNTLNNTDDFNPFLPPFTSGYTNHFEEREGHGHPAPSGRHR